MTKACKMTPQPGDDEPVNPTNPNGPKWGQLFGRLPTNELEGPGDDNPSRLNCRRVTMGFVNSKGETTTWTDPFNKKADFYFQKKYGGAAFRSVCRVGKYTVIRVKVPMVKNGTVQVYRTELYAMKQYDRTLLTKAETGKMDEGTKASMRHNRLIILGQVMSTLMALRAGKRPHPLHAKLVREIDIECLSWGS